ncbi:MAG: NAD-dependent epimerase/dehydratase family protein [Methanomassiliicoccus sp.]|nr:NAD-dependent epimerase/dehydratase family protein [Methanomassiliicoccus sp.]
MTVLITGATGFVGSHLTEELLKKGDSIDALVRRPERAEALSKLGIGIIKGDVTEPASFRGKLGKYDTIYHLANVYDFWLPDNSVLDKVNVQGTRSLLEEAKAAGVGKIIYTSSTVAIGIKSGAVGDEETEHCGYYPAEYNRSKYLGLCEVGKMVAEGAPVITVLPSAIIGPGDTKSTGQFIINYLNGKLPGMIFPDCVMAYAYVKDVARGHVLAAEKGEIGQRYILANGNYQLRDFFNMISEVSGVPPLKKTVSPTMVDMLSSMQMIKASWTKRPPQIPKDLVRVMRDGMMVDNSKGIRELGMAYTPIKEALRETVEWYRANGMARPLGP